MTCFIFWSTKDERKHHLIVEICKDLGLRSLQRGAFLGKLEETEREFFEEKLRKYLTGRKDNFYIISLCKDCWRKKISKEYEPERKILQPKKPFEIID